MSKNPFINAIGAAAYIAVVASLMFYGSRLFPREDTILAPIAVISLFTLSAAVMGYLFVYQPLQLILDGHKKNGVNLFLKTVGAFAAITVLVFVLIFFGVFK